jgi:flagellar hook-associated protein 3 FlgL
MRISQRMVTRNYMANIHKSMKNQAEIIGRGTTGLKFDRLSKNVSDGMRAMRAQETRIESEAHLATVENLILEYNSVDSNLDSIDNVLVNLQEKVLKAMSDSHGSVNQQVLAQELLSGRDQVLQFVNAKFGDKYLFSGTHNAGAAIDTKDGKLTFNGIEVEKIYREDGVFYYDDDSTAPPTKTVVPDSGDVYADIGLGLTLKNGQPDPRTAFKSSFSGLDILGFGPRDAQGTANNAYDLLTDLAVAMEAGDTDAMDRIYTRLVELTDSMRMTRTDLGTRVNFLERTQERLEVEIDNLGELESKLLTADTAEEAINLKTAEYTWMATLQLGSYILPTSLLDYLR